MKRETGFYRVRINNQWEIAYYRNDFNQWQLVGTDEIFKDQDFQKIDDVKINTQP